VCLTGDDGGGRFRPFLERAKVEGWQCREIAAVHDIMVMDPVFTAAMLLDAIRR
jgi:hypothetical protein